MKKMNQTYEEPRARIIYVKLCSPIATSPAVTTDEVGFENLQDGSDFQW